MELAILITAILVLSSTKGFFFSAIGTDINCRINALGIRIDDFKHRYDRVQERMHHEHDCISKHVIGD